MKTNTDLMVSLKKELDELLPQAQAGDEDAHIKWAMGKSLHDYLACGHKLTALDWFKHTPYYSPVANPAKAA
ncbi:MAG: hypothetical protein ACR2P5_01040 [Gammaproteobacteria bacterium]